MPAVSLVLFAAALGAPTAALAEHDDFPSAPKPVVTLSVLSGTSAVSTVPVGTAVTLSASALLGTNNLVHGLVRFCDTSVAPVCTNENKVGVAQLTRTGPATLTLTPSPGVHNYTAVSYPQMFFAGQSSAVVTLNVTAVGSSSTALTSTGSGGDYALSATVATRGNGSLVAGGTVSFVNASNNNALLGTAPLVGGNIPLALLPNSIHTTLTSGFSSVATGDFNRDGKTDMVVIGADSKQASILMGNGDGTFTTLPNGPTSIGGVYQVKVADFNEDGKPDLAMVNLYNNQIDLWLGNGDGTFTPGTTIQGGWGPIGMAVGDMNGDGIVDILRVNTYAGSVTFLAGKGDGTFTAAPDMYVSWQNPTIPVIGDFNGDGIMDFAVVVASGSQVATYMGNGDGTFKDAGVLDTGSQPTFIVAQDFDGDGILDLAVTNKGDNTVSIFLGKKNGKFHKQTTIATPTGTADLVAADFDGDGTIDLAVTSTTANVVTLLKGVGDGTFTTSVSSNAGTSPYQLAVADFNNDGVPDIAIADLSNSATVVLTQAAKAATATLANAQLVGTGAQNVVAKYSGDLNYNSSASAPLSLAARALNTRLALYPSSLISFYGQQVSLTANLSPNASGSTVTNGEAISYYSDGNLLGTATLKSGSATLHTTSIPVGFHMLTAGYTGDKAFTPAQGMNLLFVLQGWFW